MDPFLGGGEGFRSKRRFYQLEHDTFQKEADMISDATRKDFATCAQNKL